MKSLLTLICISLLAGCAIQKFPRDAGFPTTDSSLEISRDPMILANRKSEWASMSLYGIKLGDSQDRIPKKQIREEGNAGWIILTGGNRFRSGNDNRIDALGVWDQSLLGQLGVKSKEDIARLFGETTRVVPASASDTIYYFEDLHIRVIWSAMENRVTGVNVTK